MTDVAQTVTVSSHAELAEARRHVDRLATEGFPVHHLAIVWRDLRLVDDVTGRRDLVRSVLDRAWTGAFLGLVFGTLLLVFSELDDGVDGWAVLLSWVSAGIMAGAILGLAGHLLLRRRQQFSSVGRLEAAGYDLVCQRDHAAQAQAILGLTSGHGSTTADDVRSVDPSPADRDPA